MARSATTLLLALACACAAAPAAVPRAACPLPGLRVAPGPEKPTAAPGDASSGAELFADVCEGCHGVDAASRAPDAPAEAPRLDCPEWLADASDAYLYDAIARGPGRYGHGDQPPLGLLLSPEQVSDLVAYVRSLEATPAQ